MLWWTLRQLNSDDWQAREAAAQKLGELKDSQYAEALVGALKDGHGNVRRMAEWALVQMGASAVPPLAVALTVRNSEVRKAAASALAQIRDPAVPALGMALNDGDMGVRDAAGITLARIGTDSAIEQLTSALRYGNSGAREAAAAGLARLGAKAVESLVSTLTESGARAGETAIAALVRIGKPAVPQLISSLRNSAGWEAAAEALSRIDPNWVKLDSARSAVSTFITALSDSDRSRRKAAATVLGHIGDISAADRLIEVLSDPDEEVKESAATALGKLGDPRAISPMVSMLKNASAQTRDSIVAAIVKLGGILTGPLVDALKSTNKPVRESAASVLVRIGSSAVEPLVNVLWKIDPDLAKPEEETAPASGFVAVGQTSGNMTARSTSAAGHKGGQQHLPIAASSSPKQNKPGIIRATSSIGTAQEPRDIEVLSQGLEGPDSAVRESAIKELFRIGTVPDSPLVLALKNRNSAIRRAAAHALSETGDIRARETLRADLGSSSHLELLAAAESLARLEDLSVVRPLTKLLAALDDLDCESDSLVLYKACRALRALQSILAPHAGDVVSEDLDLILELKTRRAPRFLSAVAAAVSGKAAPTDEKPPGVLSALKESTEFKTVMELARSEQSRRKRNR